MDKALLTLLLLFLTGGIFGRGWGVVFLVHGKQRPDVQSDPRLLRHGADPPQHRDDTRGAM